MKNVIFFTHTEKGPSGGGKYIYKYSQIINEMKNFSSEVVHIKKKRTSKYKNSINKILNLKNKNFSGWQFNEITYICIKYKRITYSYCLSLSRNRMP